VRSSRLSQAGACFLDACHIGEPLAQALAMALQADAQCDLSALVAQMLSEGALLPPESQTPRSLK
jgi:hypothetical protein